MHLNIIPEVFCVFVAGGPGLVPLVNVEAVGGSIPLVSFVTTHCIGELDFNVEAAAALDLAVLQVELSSMSILHTL